MAKKTETKPQVRRPRPRTPEAQENRMISLAMDLAEQKLIDGTASSQLITHYLKLGSSRERLENELIRKQMEHLDVKMQAIKSAEQRDEIYAEAIEALRSYRVGGNDD